VLNLSGLGMAPRITVTSGPMFILSGGSEAASIKGVSISSGGHVKVSGLELEGTAALAAMLEIGLEVAQPLSLMQRAGLAPDEAGRKALSGSSGGQRTEAAVKARIEQAFTDALRAAVLAHRGLIPGLELATSLGISVPGECRH
jgi:hypothetical protein